jgi:WhiB family transcriptional regulator, redox-sensing transcriptional regulator
VPLLVELALGLGSGLADQHWRSRAACRGTDPELFATRRGQSPEPAFDYCRRCDVAVECLEYALELGQRACGVWGRTTGRQRREAKQRGWDAAQLLAELD